MPGGGGASGSNRPVTVGEQTAVTDFSNRIPRLIRSEGYWLGNPFPGIGVPVEQPDA